MSKETAQHTLPDCMMPDGADPCQGYHALKADNERLTALNAELVEVLELTIREAELCGVIGDIPYSEIRAALQKAKP